MAYAALISLENTIHHLLNSSDLWIVPRYQAATECQNQLKSLRKVLQSSDHSTKLNALEEQIVEAASRFEDVIESHLSDQIVKQSEEDEKRIRYFEDMHHLKQSIRSFTSRMKKMELESKKEFKKLVSEEEVRSLVQSASRFADALDFSPSDVIVTANQFKVRGNGIRIFIDLQYFRQDSESFVVRMKKVEKEYLKELQEDEDVDYVEDDDDDDDDVDDDDDDEDDDDDDVEDDDDDDDDDVDDDDDDEDDDDDDDVEDDDDDDDGGGGGGGGGGDDDDDDDEKKSTSKDAGDEISEVLYPSYTTNLPQNLKACFLYMGLFRENYKIPRSKLINMWVAEGFHEQDKMSNAGDWAVKCLEGLFSNNVAMIYQYSSVESWLDGKIKTCGLQSSVWHLCNREARESNFFYALNSLEDCAKDGVGSHRRLCFRNNVLFGIQHEVCDLIGGDHAPSARSLLCYGPYRQYQVPVWFGLRLLRVIDALNIRFYEFPIQVLKLVLLRYFALTFNGDLPTSISKLRKLQYFIVRRHLSIKSCKALSYLPMEIWDMEELKHLEVMGSDLPVPNRRGTLLPNLQTLLGVSGRSCSKDILGRISNLHKLGLQIELGLGPNEPLRWFDHISHFRELGSLKCVILNPEFKIVAPPPPRSVFPWGLKKLTLSGFGYSWEYMGAIASFRNLEVLKLQCYAFRGPKWEIKAREFMKLSSLIIEDTDLMQWELRRESLPLLVSLSLKRCYKLKEIHWEHDKYFRPKIEVVDCNPLAVACIKQIMEVASENARFVPLVDVHSSNMD